MNLTTEQLPQSILLRTDGHGAIRADRFIPFEGANRGPGSVDDADGMRPPRKDVARKRINDGMVSLVHQDLVRGMQVCNRLLIRRRTLPEETPVNEAVDTAFAIEDRVGVHLGPIVVNSCYPELALTAASATAAAAQADAELVGVFVSDHEAADLAAAAAFRGERTTIQLAQADRLGQRLPLPQIRLPFVFTSEIGFTEIEMLADAFTDGLNQI